jgi:hypothetical protein
VALLVLDAGALIVFRSRGTKVTAYAHLGYRLFFGEENEGLHGVVAATGGTRFDPDELGFACRDVEEDGAVVFSTGAGLDVKLSEGLAQ